MNKSEKVVYNYLTAKGRKLINTHKFYPDFYIDDSFYVEVKNLSNASRKKLTDNQIINFSTLDKPVFIYYVKDDVIVTKKIFRPIRDKELLSKFKKTKSILVTLEDLEYEQLIKIKGNLSWNELLLSLVKKDKKLPTTNHKYK